MISGLVVFAVIVMLGFVAAPHAPFDFGRLVAAFCLCLLWGWIAESVF